MECQQAVRPAPGIRIATVSITATSRVTPRDAFETGEWLLHVVEHTEIQHDIERAERFEVDGGEVCDHGLDVAPERLVREVEAAAPGEVGEPEVGRVARVIRQRPVLAALVPVPVACAEVESPRGNGRSATTRDTPLRSAKNA